MIYVKNVKTDGFPDAPNHVYIGRQNPRYALPRSPLANPFRIGPDGTRQQVIHLYKTWINEKLDDEHSPQTLELVRLYEIAGAGDLYLYCWCKDSREDVACHGDILAELLTPVG